ncbi:recombinase family protein [Streptomyces sp. NPDC052236]|uniref:recombinase family protein n=1 Tax=Streptomyces sp. NPDC052236 TaxID=3365686 RepID=UPI0037CD42F1
MHTRPQRRVTVKGYGLRTTTPPTPSLPFRPYGPAILWDAHVCPPRGQLIDRQIRALTDAGCSRTFSDKKSGKNAGREEPWKALDCLRPRDTLVTLSLDRLGRSSQDLIAIVLGLRKRGIGLTSLTRHSTPPRQAGAWYSTSSPPWPSSFANSSSPGPDEGPAAARALLGQGCPPELARTATYLFGGHNSRIRHTLRPQGSRGTSPHARCTVGHQMATVPNRTDGSRTA